MVCSTGLHRKYLQHDILWTVDYLHIFSETLIGCIICEHFPPKLLSPAQEKGLLILIFKEITCISDLSNRMNQWLNCKSATLFHTIVKSYYNRKLADNTDGKYLPNEIFDLKQ